MVENRGFINVPENIINAVDALVQAAYLLGTARPEQTAVLQQHEDAAYDNLMMLLDTHLSHNG
jgi:hypothetical protein